MNKGPLITLAHGNGGRFMRELIEDVFARHFGTQQLDPGLDAAPIALDPEMVAVVSTDGFIVEPLQFPGGDIGALAVHGTCNDLAVSGAVPRFLTLGAMIEEGLPLATLETIVASIAATARENDVAIVAGDTKVVPRGHGGGLYLTTTGVGERMPGCSLGLGTIRAGDEVLVSGPIGDHAVTVLLEREEFDLSGGLASDCASLLPFCQPLANMAGVRFMRDATRGGLATVAHEILRGTGLGIELRESDIPVRDEVQGVCEILGYDPWYLACEGRVVAVVDPAIAAEVVALWRTLPGGEQAARIGSVNGSAHGVVLRTELGGERMLEELEDDPLPRIC